ncbi:MAG: hypothetical protein ACFFD4_06100 [Candidatus Odinarchaeota archaeon]
MRILIFTEGTILMHNSAAGLSRKEIVKQSRDGNDPSLSDWENYIPIGESASKLRTWKAKGAKIEYLTSRTSKREVSAIQSVLRKYWFPEGQLLFREAGDAYKDVAERSLPDILIEDDCESIGGKKEMTYTCIRPELQEKVKLIAVKEFGGIDHLPDELSQLELHNL